MHCDRNSCILVIYPREDSKFHALSFLLQKLKKSVVNPRLRLMAIHLINIAVQDHHHYINFYILVLRAPSYDSLNI